MRRCVETRNDAGNHLMEHNRYDVVKATYVGHAENKKCGTMQPLPLDGKDNSTTHSMDCDTWHEIRPSFEISSSHCTSNSSEISAFVPHERLVCLSILILICLLSLR